MMISGMYKDSQIVELQKQRMQKHNKPFTCRTFDIKITWRDLVD